MGITMFSFKKEDVQYFIDTASEALGEEFEEQDTRDNLREAKKILVSGIKGVTRGGSVQFTPLECSFMWESFRAAGNDDWVHIGTREELTIASRLILGHTHNPANKVAV